jgi:hypothetical protein
MVALSLMTISSGCTTSRDYSAAVVKKSIATAAVNLPAYPDYCKKLMPLVNAKVGDKWRHIEAQWLLNRDYVNKQIAWCADNYETIRKKYALVPN